ncbi:hypothetical protein ARMGADRAFT_1090658 [Armillaria gallica]|uniref:Heterokaryon incompatibility domain-containing protein n=1 Tax=Armillaria gallica TaxID=47427 RepID=A0A2H3CGC2_ARMGA|nr:hypothetical protein ARMGADRAFT_1090658 [Armillaria gallica]
MDMIEAFLFEKTALVATYLETYACISVDLFGGQARDSKRSIGVEVTNVHSRSDSYSSILNEHTDGPQEPTSQIHSVAEDRNDGVLRMHTVLCVPVADLAWTTICLDLLAMPRNFRLVNCAASIDFNELQIIEFPNISSDAPMTSYKPTLWTDRAWTLQEASAPGKEKVKCLYKSTHASFQDFLDEECPEGTKYGFDLTNLSEVVETAVEAGRSAACEMSFLCFRFWIGIGRFNVDEPGIWEQREKFPLRIITVEVAELLHIPLYFETTRSVAALWALAYTRVNLNVEQFLPEERTKATIKLIQEVMKLYMVMPEMSESGRAYFSTTTGKVLAIDAICAEERRRAGGLPNPTPKGEMTDSVYTSCLRLRLRWSSSRLGESGKDGGEIGEYDEGLRCP